MHGHDGREVQGAAEVGRPEGADGAAPAAPTPRRTSRADTGRRRRRRAWPWGGARRAGWRRASAAVTRPSPGTAVRRRSWVPIGVSTAQRRRARGPIRASWAAHGREHRRLQRAEQRPGTAVEPAACCRFRSWWACASSVCRVATSTCEPLVGSGGRRPRMERVRRAEPGDAPRVELVGLGARQRRLPVAGHTQRVAHEHRVPGHVAGRSPGAASTSRWPPGRRARRARPAPASPRTRRCPGPCWGTRARPRRGDVEPPRRDVDAHHGAGAGGAGSEVVPGHRVLLPSAPLCARERAAPHRPPLSMQAYAPRRPAPAAAAVPRSLGYRSTSVVGTSGSGASSPAPGARGCVPQRQNRLPAPPRPRTLARSRPRYNGRTSTALVRPGRTRGAPSHRCRGSGLRLASVPASDTLPQGRTGRSSTEQWRRGPAAGGLARSGERKPEGGGGCGSERGDPSNGQAGRPLARALLTGAGAAEPPGSACRRVLRPAGRARRRRA